MRNRTAVRFAPELEFRIEEKKSFLRAVACVLDRVVNGFESGPLNSFVVCAGKGKCSRKLNVIEGLARRQARSVAAETSSP